MIPEIPVAYLLLHDNTMGDDARAKSTLEKMMAKFGTSSSFYLPINSRKMPNSASEASFWFPYANMEASAAATGGDLSRAVSVASMASMVSSDANMGHRRNISAG